MQKINITVKEYFQAKAKAEQASSAKWQRGKALGHDALVREVIDSMHERYIQSLKDSGVSIFDIDVDGLRRKIIDIAERCEREGK